MQTVIYAGQLTIGDYGENYTAVLLDTLDVPLAKEIAEDLDEFGHYASVRYWTSDAPITEERATEIAVNTALGLVSAEYEDRYSEITGYLWTDESLQVGGHDLLEELAADHWAAYGARMRIRHEKTPPRYLRLEITYSETPLAAPESGEETQP